jgi:FMN phosphatase YigB (HAD superfamily)
MSYKIVFFDVDGTLTHACMVMIKQLRSMHSDFHI